MYNTFYTERCKMFRSNSLHRLPATFQTNVAVDELVVAPLDFLFQRLQHES